MSRDGSGIYTKPFPDVAEGTTIESAVHNGTVADIEQDLNLPRPIVAGGTGANNARDAMLALSGEIAAQVITNYDSNVFAAGSFTSGPGATSAPDVAPGGSSGQYFSGYAYGNNGSLMTIEARSLSTGKKYWRRFNTGPGWNAWAEMASDFADMDLRFVNAGGDTMTGDLTISKAFPAVVMSAQASGQSNSIYGFLGAGAASKQRWLLRIGNGENETGSNVGSNFDLSRYADDGSYLGSPLSISRANGNATFAQNLTVGGQITAAAWSGNLTVTGNTITLGATTTIIDNGNTTYYRNLKHQFQTIGGAANLAILDGSGLTVTGTLAAGAGGLYLSNWASVPNAGVIFFGPAATSYIYGTQGAGLQTAGFTSFNTAALFCTAITASGTVQGPTVVATGQVWAQGGVCYLNAAGTAYLQFDAGGGNLNFQNPSAGVSLNLLASGRVTLGKGMSCKAGANGAYQGYMFNVNWNGAANYNCYLDATYVGDIAFVSDYRVKKDVIDLPGMWDTVKGLRPIKYTAAEFSPPSYVEHHAELKRQARKLRRKDATPEVGPMYAADNIERWGFIAHELQDALVPSAATAEKDAPDAMQSPNPWTVIAALTKALQEAMTRIEALEAR